MVDPHLPLRDRRNPACRPDKTKGVCMTTLAQVLKPLDPNHSLPLYQQLQRAVREAIERRVLGPDDALPSERQLAEDFAVSRITVRRAIEGLAEEGWLVRRQGSGNFVSSRVEKNFAKLTSFSEDMRARGSRPHSVWLRYADDAPMAIEIATVVASCLPSLEAVGDSLYAALEQQGNRPVRALQRLRALLLNAEQARLLEANVGDAGLLVERLGYLRDGRAIELSQSFYRGDMYDLVAELNAG
jgi:GntR family transcriptional regulator